MTSTQKGRSLSFHTDKRKVVGQVRGEQTTVHGPNPAHHLFLYSLQAKNGFYIFTCWEEGKTIMTREIMRNSNFSVHTDTEQRHTHSLMHRPQLFLGCNDRAEQLPRRLRGLQSQKSLPRRYGSLQKKFADGCPESKVCIDSKDKTR